MSADIQNIRAVLKEHRVIFIIRLSVSTYIGNMVEAIWEAGGRFVEVTMNTPGALDILASLSSRVPSNAYLGAGTVCCAEDVELISNTGLHFAVTPVSSEPLITALNEHQIMSIAGASTPTEIFNAHSWGADFVKVFPAQSPSYIKSLWGPLGHIPMLAVGGVTKENAMKYIRAGCVGVGTGGSFFDVNRDGSFDAAELKTAVRAMVRVCELTSSAD